MAYQTVRKTPCTVPCVHLIDESTRQIITASLQARFLIRAAVIRSCRRLL